MGQNSPFKKFDSSDVFFTNRLFSWHLVPDLVIGRAGFGQWIIAHARAKRVRVIDSTQTMVSIHLTTRDGNTSNQKAPRKACNHDMFARLQTHYNLDSGLVGCVTEHTVYNEQGEVELRKRKLIPPNCTQH
jgi:hypothetical protein